MKKIDFYPATLTDREAFALMSADDSLRISDAEGSIIKPDAWILYEDTDFKSGELKEILTIRVDDQIFSTISPTFIRKFKAIVDNLGSDVGEIRISSGQSKAGRSYITCNVNW